MVQLSPHSVPLVLTRPPLQRRQAREGESRYRVPRDALLIFDEDILIVLQYSRHETYVSLNFSYWAGTFSSGRRLGKSRIGNPAQRARAAGMHTFQAFHQLLVVILLLPRSVPKR